MLLATKMLVFELCFIWSAHDNIIAVNYVFHYPTVSLDNSWIAWFNRWLTQRQTENLTLFAHAHMWDNYSADPAYTLIHRIALVMAWSITLLWREQIHIRNVFSGRGHSHRLSSHNSQVWLLVKSSTTCFDQLEHWLRWNSRWPLIALYMQFSCWPLTTLW